LELSKNIHVEDMERWKSQIVLGKVPNHVAVIMDGNGRWAKQQGQDRTFGHMNGVGAVRECVEAAAEIGVKHLTLYAFSTENWGRPKEEIDALMDLLIRTVLSEVETLNKNGIRLKAIGNLDHLPADCLKVLNEGIAQTANNKHITLHLALSYSSKLEITEAIKTIGTKLLDGEINISDISEEMVDQHLTTVDVPDPDLLIRTSGEQRVSNFLLWQIAYSELYFTPTLWPDFKKEDLFQAIVEYQQRERRFGKISEQIAN
jgi:undecaprenyl diphosphate synthase